MLTNRKRHLITNEKHFIVVKRDCRLLNETRDYLKRLFNFKNNIMITTFINVFSVLKNFLIRLKSLKSF